MPYPTPPAESPHRNRAEDRLGPYEIVYDIRRGYDRPVRERRRAGDVLLFRGREEAEPSEATPGEGG